MRRFGHPLHPRVAMAAGPVHRQGNAGRAWPAVWLGLGGSQLAGTAWLLCLVFGIPWTAWSAALTITVRSTVVVQGPEITIGDVAEVRGDSAAEVAEVRRVVMGQSPPAGQERLLYGRHIVARLKQHGLPVNDLELHTPAKIRVTRASRHLPSREIEAVVMQAIHSRMPWDRQQATIRLLRGIKPVVLSAGPVHTEVSFPVHNDFLGPTSFTVSFRVDGNLEKRLYGTATIEVTQDIVTTVRPLDRGAIITEADIHLTQVSLSRLPRRVLMHPEDVIGKRTKRTLQAQAMIHAYEVENLPLVRRGDAILILVESPTLTVTTVGEALEAGHRGDTIRVRNVMSRREVRAVVVDRKTVKVPF